MFSIYCGHGKNNLHFDKDKKIRFDCLFSASPGSNSFVLPVLQAWAAQVVEEGECSASLLLQYVRSL